MQNRLFCASLLLASFALPAYAQLVFQAPDPIALRAGSGEVTFTLSTSPKDPKDSTPIPLQPTAGPVVDSATKTVITGATAKIDNGNPPTTIAQGTTLSLTANVTGISGTSQAEFTILNGVSQLGTLSAFASDAALTVSIDGDGSAPDKTLAYTRSSPVVIALKNSDALTYHLHWEFQIDNKAESSGDMYMAPSGSSRITIAPTNNPFSILDLVHPSNKKGVLLLSVIPPANIPAAANVTAPTNVPGPPSVPDGLLPTRSLPVSLVMQPLSSFWSAFCPAAHVAVLLLIGGLFSFLASSMLPNMQKKRHPARAVAGPRQPHHHTSTRIDSYLRVLLRLERSRIRNLHRQRARMDSCLR